MNMRTLASAIAVLALSQCAPAFASDADLADLTLPPLPIGVCNNEVEKAKANSNHIDLMRLAVCVHVNGNIDVAFNIYERIRKSVPGYAYVLVSELHIDHDIVSPLIWIH